MMKTDRLILRPWLESDAEALFKYASDVVNRGVDQSVVIGSCHLWLVGFHEREMLVSTIRLHNHSPVVKWAYALLMVAQGMAMSGDMDCNPADLMAPEIRPHFDEWINTKLMSTWRDPTGALVRAPSDLDSL